jgi:hypothetical protein
MLLSAYLHVATCGFTQFFEINSAAVRLYTPRSVYLSSLINQLTPQSSRNSSHFIKPECSSPCSQQPATCPYCKPQKSSQISPILFKIQ